MKCLTVRWRVSLREFLLKIEQSKPPAERLTGLKRNIKQQQASNKKIPKYLFQDDVVQRV